MNNPFEAIDTRLSNIESILLEIRQTPHNSPQVQDTEELLTVQDAAKFLTLRVPTIYGLISKGEIPVMKRSKRCYFLKADLVAYLKNGRKKSNAEITAEADKHLARKSS